jgi:hypothetical protein
MTEYIVGLYITVAQFVTPIPPIESGETNFDKAVLCTKHEVRRLDKEFKVFNHSNLTNEQVDAYVNAIMFCNLKYSSFQF